MENFKKELKELLIKYDAMIFLEQEEDGNFLFLKLIAGKEEEIIDSGYRDLIINETTLK